MYDQFTGEVLETHPARVVLGVGGVGYDLKVPVTASNGLSVGQNLRLYTILHVVDGQPSLLGFRSQFDRDLAKRILSVTGVGPAMCLAILSMYPARLVVQALQDGNHQLLQKAKGVGAKTAERLCLELKDHAQKLDVGSASEPTVTLLPPSSEDAVAALMTLGYAERDARKRVQRQFQDHPSANTEELIKRVLQG